ncbi:Permease of the drug/metabolite transporter (DMT) superfamily [Salipiger thiooxidans]|uniref:Permease of the drug/metabolite transporter (DMT) superfamily n=1 Tax=Salipiger thiooxidans TaxID=282683 RepID=A0A1G7F4P5_9RHOB|nr:DMT family transporter [Salipiger thiooxidans]SDE70716.1 Permease of the drug/metabolite transporter (DMT) superfamily [Salipiger thiooxidans]
MADGVGPGPGSGPGARGNALGALFMVIAMTLFAVEDSLFKSVTPALPPGVATLIFGLTGTTLYVLMTLRAGEPVLHPAILRPSLMIRTFFEIVGRLFFALSLAYTPLSVTSSILQAAPLVVTAGAALLLNETVGPRRWAAMAIGFVGVLMILRPTPDAFRPDALLAVAGMIGFAMRDLFTRASPPAVSANQLGVLGFAVIVTAGLLMLPFDPTPPRLPDAGELWRLLLTGVVGVTAYTALTRAMRSGEVSVVAPFRYSRLLVALLFAFLFFGERPDLWTLAGGALIVTSGLYTLIRSARKG